MRPLHILIIASLVGIIQPRPVVAAPLTETINSRWNSLWINKEQQAEKALKKQQYDKASSLSKKPSMRGTAHYKKEDYKKALEEFKQVKGADARYNEGNALAKLEKYQEAINAYDKALKLQPEMDDAKKNKMAIETLLKNKKEQEDDNKNSKKGDSKKEDQNNKDSKNKDGKTGEQGEKKEGEKGEEGKQNKNKNSSKNQFSDANKDLDKQKDKKKTQDKTDKKKSNEQSQQDGNKSKKSPNEAQKNKTENDSKKPKGTKASKKELTKEEKMAAEQWLRRIPDDPGGLLRRKFEAQYKQRRGSINSTKQPW